jgi:hypothetical protein
VLYLAQHQDLVGQPFKVLEFNLGWLNMAKQITYGIGGYDPSKPNNNIVEEIDIPDTETE